MARSGRSLVLLSVFSFALLASGFDGQTAVTQQRQQAKTPPKPKPTAMLPDVTVASPHIDLTETDLGKPGIEFPNDKVKFTAVFKNSGLGPCPPGGSYSITLSRNGQFLASSVATELLGGPGSTYNYSYSDSFIHAQWTQVSYKITVGPSFAEADPNNNSAEAMAGEEILHGSGNPDFGITDFTSSFVDGPAGRTYYFAVTVKNFSPIYSRLGSVGYVEIENTAASRSLASLRVADRHWPGPGSQAKFTLSAKASEMPAGSYSVRAKISPEYDPNRSNDVSTQTPLIKNIP